MSSDFLFVVRESDVEGFLEIESQGFITFIHERLAGIRKPFPIIFGEKWKPSVSFTWSLYTLDLSDTSHHWTDAL